MKRAYNTPEMTRIFFESSDVITSSAGMTLGTFTTGMVLNGEDFGEFNDSGY
ncbi:MAG: hypothetical protein IJ011_05460 [Clostridia bacterium]|nr:hypothetical protein [Clostridia bacterium]